MVQGTLAVPPSQTLALVGRNVEFNSGTAIAESGRLEVGSVRQGSVTLSPSKIGWHLRYNQVQAFSDIQLLSESALLNPNVVSNPFGGIQIQGRHIRLSQSEVRAQMLADQPGADINVQASQSLEIGGEVDSFFPFSSWIANVVETNANGNGGSIKINVPKVSLLDGGRIQTLSLGNGSAGNVQVKADTLSLNGGASPIMNTRRELGDSLNSQISSSNFSNGVGGNVTITAHSLSLTNGGRIGTLVGPSASSQGGNVDVTISKSIFGKEVNPFQRDSGSGITTFTFGNGNAGQINVSTQQLSLRAGGQISSRSLNFPFGNQGFSPGTGNAGNVDVQANQSIHLQGASRLSPDIISFLGSINNGTGKGSDVSVTTPQLTVAEGASVSSAVFSLRLVLVCCHQEWERGRR